MAFTRFAALQVAAHLPLLVTLWLAYGVYQDYSALKKEGDAMERSALEAKRALSEKEAQLTALLEATQEVEESIQDVDVVLALTRGPKWEADWNRYHQMQEDVRGFCEALLDPSSDLAAAVRDSLKRPDSKDPLDQYLHLQYRSRGWCEDLFDPSSELHKAVQERRAGYTHIRAK